MSGFMSLNNSTSKRVLNLLELVKLTVWKVMIARVTIVKFRMNDGGGNDAGCFEVSKPQFFTFIFAYSLHFCSWYLVLVHTISEVLL